MAYRIEKTEDGEDIVIDDFETGIAASPHKGIANIQNANISTETGEILASFNRFQQSQTPIAAGTLTASVGAGTSWLDVSTTLNVGQWINVTSNTIVFDGVTANYLVVGGGGGGDNLVNDGQGGGGAGDVLTGTTAIAQTTHSTAITVDPGGAVNTNGGSSIIAGVATATGGGHGGATAANGANGASGGGGGAGSPGDANSGGTATGSGHNGGNGSQNASTSLRAGGGGGGAGVAGGNASGSTSGTGGNGVASSISGASVTYGGGGSGATASGAAGVAGTGGGGTGSHGATQATAGTANTGGGGGGGGAAGGSGIVIISYPVSTLNATGGTITTVGGNKIHTFTSSGTFTVTAPAVYYVSAKNAQGQVKLSQYYDPSVSNVATHGTTGTMTFSTTNMGQPVAKAIEKYNSSSATYHRYYVLDSLGLVWVYDSQNDSTTGLTWFLPDTSTAYFSGTVPSGIAILQGWLMVFGNKIYCKQTVNLGGTNATTSLYNTAALEAFMSPATTTNPHYAITGHQGRCYYTDGNFIGSIFPDTSIQSGLNNLQSYCSYTASSTTGTITAVLSGSVPLVMNGSSVSRVPAVFFTLEAGTMPSALSANTVYWIEYQISAGTINVYAAQTGGSPLNIQSGAVGNQYFNTFWLLGEAAAGGLHTTLTSTNQRVNLPVFEVAQSLVEIGNTVLIGCKGSVVYPWNQIDATPSSLINIPEADVPVMVTVNQMAYLFAGHKGNIYITDGSTASLVIKVPDYCAGLPGSPATYVEPYYTWGDAAYIRGRVYFSILDQTSTKTGNCGGVWSFVPTQNLYIGQDTGLALRLQNQNSYNTYSGVATVLIPRETQTSGNALYWAGWYSDVTSPTYGIDYSNTGTNANFTTVVETDLMPIGTMLNKKTFAQIEYKFASPIDGTIALNYRKNRTDAWTTCGTAIAEPSSLSGYFRPPFQNVQWLQLQIILTPATSTAASNTFMPLTEVRLR